MNRGFTLIEMLLALALLGVIAIAAAAWVQIAGRASAEHLPQARWLAAAEAAIRLVEDEIAIGDFEPPLSSPRKIAGGGNEAAAHLQRVKCVDGVLVIKTRLPGKGALNGTYTLDASSGELRVTHSSAAGGSDQLLLSGVGQFACAIDEAPRTLMVALESSEAAWRIERRLILP